MQINEEEEEKTEGEKMNNENKLMETRTDPPTKILRRFLLRFYSVT